MRRLREIAIPLLLFFLPGVLPAQYVGSGRPLGRAEVLDSLSRLRDDLAGKGDTSTVRVIQAALDSLALASAAQDSMLKAGADADSTSLDSLRSELDTEVTRLDSLIGLIATTISDSLDADTLRNVILTVPARDSTATGIEYRGTAGETITFGQQVYAKSDGKYWLTDADAASTGKGVAVCITKAATAANNPIKLLTFGFVRCDAWNWSVNGTLYTSTTTGAFQQTAVSGSGDQVQFAGYAKTADVIFYDPCPILIEVK